MNRDDIIRMAVELGMVFNVDDLERFAALVAAHEREACEAAAYDNRIGCDCPCAAVIRARGEKP